MAERILRPLGSAVPATSDGAAVAPFQFVLAGTENLRLRVYSVFVNVVVTAHGRMLRPTGEIHPFVQALRITQAGLEQFGYFQLGPGALLSCVVSASFASTPANYGDVYCEAAIVQGVDATADVRGVLVQNYLSGGVSAVWPGTPFRSSLEGPPIPDLIQFPAGAPGVAASWTLTPTKHQCLHTVAFTFTTDATAGNRRVIAVLRYGVLAAGVFVSPILQPASVAWSYTLAFGGVSDGQADVGVVSIGLPAPFRMTFANELHIQWGVTVGVGDTVGVGTALVTRWLDRT